MTVRAPTNPLGVVIVAHGGASRRGKATVSPTQLSVLRMIPVAQRIARAGNGGLAVHRLLNSRRGWDASHTPVNDIEWALGEVGARYGAGTPVALVGHSLGGRAAILAASQPSVRSVVALSAFVYPADADRVKLHNRQILFVHGLRDRIAPVQRARHLARRLALWNDVGFVAIPAGKHAMLAKRRTFELAAAGFVTTTLLGTPPPRLIARIFRGESYIETN